MLWLLLPKAMVQSAQQESQVSCKARARVQDLLDTTMTKLRLSEKTILKLCAGLFQG